MPDLPCVGIARTEGLRLKELCQQGTVRVWLNAQADNGWKPLTMTTAEFGAQRDRQFMLIGGHMDSWFGPQATDNAAGDACIMELARVFRQHDDELRRGLVAGLWMGHETGTMISSSRFADVNWDRLRQILRRLSPDRSARHHRFVGLGPPLDRRHPVLRHAGRAWSAWRHADALAPPAEERRLLLLRRGLGLYRRRDVLHRRGDPAHGIGDARLVASLDREHHRQARQGPARARTCASTPTGCGDC